MVRFIFWVLVFCVIGTLSVLFLKDKLGMFSAENFNVDKFTGAMINNKDKDNFNPMKKDEDKQEEPTKTKSDIYFVKLQGSSEVYIPVQKEFEETNETEQFEAVIKTLLDGPATAGKFQGLYSEIPENTKLISVKEKNNAYIINLSDDFEYGGGTESISTRFMQLVLTATNASQGKDVYLQINGSMVEMLGGEGMMIKQPLKENL